MTPEDETRRGTGSGGDAFEGRDLLVGRPEGAGGGSAPGAAGPPPAPASPQPAAQDAAVREILATMQTIAARLDTLRDTPEQERESAEARRLRLGGAHRQRDHRLPASHPSIAGRDDPVLSGRHPHRRAARRGIRRHDGPVGNHGRDRHAPEGRRHDGALLRSGRLLRPQRPRAPQGERLVRRGSGDAGPARSGHVLRVLDCSPSLRAEKTVGGTGVEAERGETPFCTWMRCSRDMRASCGAASSAGALMAFRANRQNRQHKPAHCERCDYRFCGQTPYLTGTYSVSLAGREPPSRITHCGAVLFSSSWRLAPHTAQHGLSEHDGRCGLAPTSTSAWRRGGAYASL